MTCFNLSGAAFDHSFEIVLNINIAVSKTGVYQNVPEVFDSSQSERSQTEKKNTRMPVYICRAGANSSEPWRHGLQVYAAPFQLMDLSEDNSAGGQNNDNVCNVAPRMMSSSGGTTEGQSDTSNNDTQPQRQFRAGQIFSATNTYSNSVSREQQIESLMFGMPVRRIRHAEVVLVDDVCVAYDRHWLRLRWPGNKGGFAGYVALGKVNETNISRETLQTLQPRGV